MSPLAERLNNYTCNNQILIAFANSAYEQVLDNWLFHIRKLGIENYIIIALDNKLHGALQMRGVHSYLGREIESLSDLWIYRIQIISAALEQGLDVVHSDTDAVWLHNPLPMLREVESELAFSQGTVWPADVHNAWGFVLCCGLFSIKSSPASAAFCLRWLSALDGDRDDQRALNRLLLGDGIIWPKAPSYTLSFRNQDVRCYQARLVGTAPDLKVTMLPHRLFQRLPEQADDVYVKHPIGDKQQVSTIEVLKENGCWGPSSCGAGD